MKKTINLQTGIGVPVTAIRRNAEMGIYPSTIGFTQIMDKFTTEEALRIAYIPIILSKAAFEYAKFVTRICAELKLPFKHQVRVIKWCISEYERTQIGNVRPEILARLEKQVEFFFEQADDDVDNLWTIIRQELTDKYPDLPHIGLFVNIYVCVSLLGYVWKFEASANHMIQKRTNTPYSNVVNPYCIEIRNACLSIADNYKLTKSKIIEIGVQAIAQKVDQIAIQLPSANETDNSNNNSYEK